MSRARTLTLTLAEIYRNAARLIERNKNCGQGCCAAIWRVQGEPKTASGVVTFRDYGTLAHEVFDLYCRWKDGTEKFGEQRSDFGWNGRTPEAYDHRIVMLYTLAAMASAGDLVEDVLLSSRFSTS